MSRRTPSTGVSPCRRSAPTNGSRPRRTRAWNGTSGDRGIERPRLVLSSLSVDCLVGRPTLRGSPLDGALLGPIVAPLPESVHHLQSAHTDVRFRHASRSRGGPKGGARRFSWSTLPFAPRLVSLRSPR